MADLPKMWGKMSSALQKKWWAAHGGGKPFPSAEGRSAAAAKRSPAKKGVATSELSRGEKTASGKISDVRRENMRRMKAAMERGTAGAPQKTSGAGGSGAYSPSSMKDIRAAIKSGAGVRTGLAGHSNYDEVLPEKDKKKMKEEKDLTGALRKSIESKGKHTVTRNKAGTLVLRKMKNEEVEQVDEGASRHLRYTGTVGGQDYSMTIPRNGDLEDHMTARKIKKQNPHLKPHHVTALVNATGEDEEHVNVEHGGKKYKVHVVNHQEPKMVYNEEIEQVDENWVSLSTPIGAGYRSIEDHENNLKAAGVSFRKKRSPYENHVAFEVPPKHERKAKKILWREEVEYIEEKLTAGDPASKWISDFVHSDNPKFEGKSKKERMNMALGAYYAKKRAKNEEVVQEKLDPVGSETTDINNDKKVDKTDAYLHARRQAIGKAIAKKKGL